MTFVTSLFVPVRCCGAGRWRGPVLHVCGDGEALLKETFHLARPHGPQHHLPGRDRLPRAQEVSRSLLRHCTVLYSAVLYCVVLYGTVLYSKEYAVYRWTASDPRGAPHSATILDSVVYCTSISDHHIIQCMYLMHECTVHYMHYVLSMPCFLLTLSIPRAEGAHSGEGGQSDAQGGGGAGAARLLAVLLTETDGVGGDAGGAAGGRHRTDCTRWTMQCCARAASTWYSAHPCFVSL